MSESDAPAADWYPDPSGRFQFRYWDGETWTGHVSTEGRTDWDPPGEAEDESSAAADVAGAGADHAEEADVVADGDRQWAPEPSAAEDLIAPSSDDGGSEPSGGAGDGATTPEHLGDEPDDTNLAANRRAGIGADVQAWLDEVAGQVELRLSRITREWTASPQADAARACAYGLLMGHLAHLHPHMRPELGQVAEAHPSFTTLEAGQRLDTLEQIARDASRAAAWLGPLIGTAEVDKVAMLFD